MSDMTSTTHRLDRLTDASVAVLVAALEAIGANATSLEDVAQRTVEELRRSLVDSKNSPGCPLVRFYVTRRFDELDEAQQEFASAALKGHVATDGMKCLTLVGTAGEEKAWNSCDASVGHRAIPLPSHAIVAKAPMIASMISQFGIELGTLLDPRPVNLRAAEQKMYNVFHVQDALGSALIPAQYQFVVPYKICSVVGFGGMLPTGQLFAVILFSRVSISGEIADLFKGLALSVKNAILPHVLTAGG